MAFGLSIRGTCAHAQPTGAHATRAERNSNLEYYCAYRRHLRCHLEIMEDLGMSLISEQLSDKPPLALKVYMDARVIKHNRDREIKHRAWAPWADALGDRQPQQLGAKRTSRYMRARLQKASRPG